MTRQIANPLQALVARAAATPARTGEVAAIRARMRPGHHTHVVLLDVSGSMDTRDDGRQRRIDHLRAALQQLVQPDHALLAFATSVTRLVSVADLPEPGGGTSLELALDAAGRLDPAATLVVSDGEPTIPDAALAAAQRLPGRIDVLYCGDDGNSKAIAFMRALATAGGGRVVVHRWEPRAPTLAASLRPLLLSGPTRGRA